MVLSYRLFRIGGTACGAPAASAWRNFADPPAGIKPNLPRSSSRGAPAQIGRRGLRRKPCDRLGPAAAPPAPRRPGGAAPRCAPPPPCRPTTTITGTCARLCSRILALIFSWRGRAAPPARPPANAAATSRGVFVGVGHDGRHHHLHRRQPEREAAGILLDQDAEEALEAAEDGAVQHHRPPAAPSSATYSASSRSGSTKSTCKVPHCQSRPIASRSTNSSLGP